MAIIRALVTAGANIHLSNHFGGTCLINSVQSVDLVKFLIRHGADVNAEDVQHKTALHYAIQVGKYRVSQKGSILSTSTKDQILLFRTLCTSHMKDINLFSSRSIDLILPRYL